MIFLVIDALTSRGLVCKSILKIAEVVSLKVRAERGPCDSCMLVIRDLFYGTKHFFPNVPGKR